MVLELFEDENDCVKRGKTRQWLRERPEKNNVSNSFAFIKNALEVQKAVCETTFSFFKKWLWICFLREEKSEAIAKYYSLKRPV